MAEQVYNFKTIGDVAFVKNSRAKSLRITVKPNDKVKVTIPRFVSLSNAFRFVEEKQDWIMKSMEKMKSIEQKATVFKPGVEFATKAHMLEFHHLPEGKLTAKVSNGLIRIFYNSETQLLTTEAQAFIVKAIEYTLRKEAKAYLPIRTKFLAEKYGFQYSRLCLKNLRSRWGSCSTVNNLNATICGGSNNIINADVKLGTFIGGGGDNSIKTDSSGYATIVSGFGNLINLDGAFGFIGGGSGNTLGDITAGPSSAGLSRWFGRSPGSASEGTHLGARSLGFLEVCEAHSSCSRSLRRSSLEMVRLRSWRSQTAPIGVPTEGSCLQN